MVMLVTQCQLPRMVCTSRTTPATGSRTKIQMLLCGILKETLAATTGKREVAVCCFIGLTSFFVHCFTETCLLFVMQGSKVRRCEHYQKTGDVSPRHSQCTASYGDPSHAE